MLENQQVALDARLRIAGMLPEPPVIPEPDMRIKDVRKRDKAHGRAIRDAEHRFASATAQAYESARSPWMGCNAGRAIAQTPDLRKVLASVPDVPTLWQAITRIRATYARYWQAIGAPPPYAKGMNLELEPEPFGSDDVDVTDGGWDDRSEEERVKAATDAMMHIEGVLGMAGYGVASEVKGVVLGDAAVRSLPKLLVGLLAVLRDG
jgi:hypothetical protein